jgi:integration host factor subunit beta
MVKSELINQIAAKQSNLTLHDVELGVNHILERMSNSLGDGERIEIRGFGSFSLHYRPPRKAHNPKTGERVYTTAKYTPHFKPGKDLRERVNNNKDRYPLKDVSGEHDDDDEGDSTNF